jgi:hypothetical protein
MEYDRESKTYSARCGVCGKVHTQKKAWFRSRSATILKLRFKFAFCDTCGKWICGDCFLIDDGKGNGIGICSACAKERGRIGLTSAQFVDAWPALQARIRAKVEAGKEVITNETNDKGKSKREE